MVISFFGYTPPARYDSVPWTQVRIEECSTVDGSYAEVDTADLFPIDINPADPMVRGITTTEATSGYFYRFVWIDGNADESAPTEPVQEIEPGTPFATAAELKSLLKITNSDQDDAIDRVMSSAAGEIIHEIGTDQLSGWKLDLAAEVNLERASEHWAQLKSPFGFIGLGNVEIHSTPAIAARDSWDRHAIKLTPLKTSWGIA